MARFNVPDGPGGEATMIWTLRPPLGGVVERMIRAPSVLGAGVAPLISPAQSISEGER